MNFDQHFLSRDSRPSESTLTANKWFQRTGLLLLLILGMGFAVPLTTVEEEFPIANRVHGLLLSAQGDASGPETEWDRQKSILAGNGLIVVTPDDSGSSTSRSEELLKLTKLLLEKTVLPSSGQIGTWLSDGTLHAIELDLFATNDPLHAPAASERLGTIGKLTGLDSGGQPATLGWIYCYDSTLYQARVTALASATGGPVAGNQTLFTGPTIQSSGEGSFAVFLNMDNSSIVGDLLSNGGIRVDGDSNEVTNYLTARSSIVATGTGSSLGTEVTVTQVSALPTPEQTALQYENLAKATSTFFNMSITIVGDGAGGFETSQGLPISGVVYAAGDISANFSGLTGSLTLISEGSIEFLGSNNNISAAVDDLAAWAIKDPVGQEDRVLVVSGADNSFVGRVFAPGGTVEVLGDNTSIVGSLYGRKVVVAGDGQAISDGTTL